MEKTKKPLRIFVVDDHRDIADGLAEVLRVHGHHVEVAYNGEQAVRIFREKDFDIAFMDVMMPGMNGVESFLAIRRIKPDAKVMMMTGYSVEQLLDQVVEKGAYGVLHKPVSMDDILETLERVKSNGVVLIADSNQQFGASIKGVLEKNGYRTTVARTGKEALNKVLNGGIDILMLGQELPVLSGLEVYMEMRRRQRVVPTIIVTEAGKNYDSDLQNLHNFATTGILTKPFNTEQLLEALSRFSTHADKEDEVTEPVATYEPPRPAPAPVYEPPQQAAPAPAPTYQPPQPAPAPAAYTPPPQPSAQPDMERPSVAPAPGGYGSTDPGITIRRDSTPAVPQEAAPVTTDADASEPPASAGLDMPPATAPIAAEEPVTAPAAEEPVTTPAAEVLPPEAHAPEVLPPVADEPAAADEQPAPVVAEAPETSVTADEDPVFPESPESIAEPPPRQASYEDEPFLPEIDDEPAASASEGLGAAAYSPYEPSEPEPEPDISDAKTIDVKPTVIEEEEPAPEEHFAPSVEVKGRIAVVDDDVDLADGLRDVLMTQGYEVRTAYSASEAEQLISSFEAQIALLDIRLGKANGLDLILTLKEMRPDIYCVMITGNSDKESAITALKRGAFNYLSKPLHPQELFAVIENCLDKYFLDQQMRKAFLDLQQAKEKAEAHSKTVVEFYEDIGKTLDSLIETVRDSSNTMLDEAWGPLGAKPYIDNAKAILECATRIDGILDIAGDLVKAKIGVLEMDEDEVDISSMLNNSAQLARSAIGEANGPEIRTEFAGDIPLIWGDERLLKSVVMNLLANSVEATNVDGRITIGAEWDGKNDLILQIQDTRPAVVEQIGAGNEPTKESLGRALVDKIAELHGGRVDIDEPSSGGMSVTFHLPATRIVAPASAA